MSKLAQSLGNISVPAMSRLRGGGRIDYKQARVDVDPNQSKLPETLGKLAKFGAEAYEKYDDFAKSRADERSNEIIRKLSPEQRRQAIQDGTLLYQDDPYAMEALRIKTGRNAAFLIDDEVSVKIKNGEFRTRQEMEDYRLKRLTEGATEFSEQFGINESDEYFQKGFNSDITERNIALYGAHDVFLSEQAKNGAVIQSRVELGSILNDPDLLRSSKAGQYFESYINDGLRTGTIPSDQQALTMISQSLSDVVNKEGGAPFLQSLENKTVTLNGTTSTYKELLGNEQWNAMMITAQKNEFTLNAKKTEGLRLSIGSAINQENTATAWAQLQQIKSQLDLVQTGEEMTPERDMLIRAQEHLQNRFAQEAAAAAKEMDKEQKLINKNAVIEEQFNKRLRGEYVSTNYQDLPTNKNTGEFKHSDMVNYANQKLIEIDSLNVPEQVKDKMKLDYLRADSEKGAFRTAVGELVGDAQKEWNAAVINGKLPDNPVAMNALRRIRNADPNLVASLYPEQAEMFLTLDMLDKQGIDEQVLLDADKGRRMLTKEMQYEDDKAWASVKNNSESPELSRIPASLDSAARKVYDSVKYRTGNSDMAMQQTDKYLKENTVTFQSDDVDGKTIGLLPKNSLKVSDDPDSWKQGQDVLQSAIDGVIKSNPWITNKQLTVYEKNNSIYLMDTTGSINIRYDQELLQRVWQDNQRRLDEKLRDEALKDANKRTLHTRAQIRRQERMKDKPVREGSMYDSVSGQGMLDVLTGKSED
ncbi:MAG: hypothetical protein [Caudoviricetes sp.]|nr:MAG: hypothetical protein [Caudoviricetes sp.]